MCPSQLISNVQCRLGRAWVEIRIHAIQISPRRPKTAQRLHLGQPRHANVLQRRRRDLRTHGPKILEPSAIPEQFYHLRRS